MALPAPSADLCFSSDVFLEDGFSVDSFVSQCRQHVTIEHLRDDLENYFKTLKAAMVELINKDYADFVDLSSNLVGMDKQIDSQMAPLMRLKEEIMTIHTSMGSVIDMLEQKLATRAAIRKKKAVLQNVMSVLSLVAMVEQLLGISGPQGSTTREELTVAELDRMAMEFNRLQHCARAVSDHPTVRQLTPRLEVITGQFQAVLERQFTSALRDGDHSQLLHCLETYFLIGRREAAEDLFRASFVRPYMEQVISAKALLTHPEGLTGIYADVLHFIPKHCGFLLGVCQGIDSGRGSGGFDFVVNSVWPQVVATIEAKASVIFAPGNPDNFFKHYHASVRFLSQFESHCSSIVSVKKLRAHPSYSLFINKWSLPVYFQIRFQEIAGKLESILTLPLIMSEKNSQFRMQVFEELLACLSMCWAEGIFIPALAHRFWKLTLQLLTRVATWLGEVLDADQALPVASYVTMASDIEALKPQVLVIHNQHILPVICNYTSNSLVLTDGLSKACDQIYQSMPKISEQIVDILGRECMRLLEPAFTVPRLYRRTNREVPSKPSSYVMMALKPLNVLEEVEPVHKLGWIRRIVDSVTERYYAITDEVLTSVKRTEESLMKLKQSRKSSTLMADVSSGMSDDNKIRLQLAMDIEQYSQKVDSLLPSASSLPALERLLEMARTAKAAAVTTTS